LLLHGGWGGAEAHWSGVWDMLAWHFRVIAPELPGIAADSDQPPLKTVGDYAVWLDGLLQALDLPAVWVVGNSFGAMLGWRFAAAAPRRARGLVMANGVPAVDVGAAQRFLVTRTILRRIALWRLRRLAYSPEAMEAACPDAERLPPEIATALAYPARRQLETMFDILLSGEAASPAPRCPLLFLWGEADRLPGSEPEVARRLAAETPGSELQLVPGAGHLPQLDRPAAFVHAVARFVRGGATAKSA
jgi:pimeloyl-ACP methyl ester carboxylesterase